MQAGLARSSFWMPKLGYRPVLFLVCWLYLTAVTVNENSCTGGSAAAIDCPAGKASANTGNDALTDCTDCSAGYYSTAGLSACIQCPAGTKCASTGTATPVNCNTGTYSAQGATTCTTCPAGSYCSSATSCITCTAGYECDPHLAHNVMKAMNAPAQGCPHQHLVQLVTLLLRDLLLVRSVMQTKFPAQLTAYVNLVLLDLHARTLRNHTTCCSGYLALQGDAVCTLCPKGNSATACTGGYYSLLGEAVCTQCPSGSKCPTTTASPIACAGAGATTCTQCPAGFTCSGGTATQCAAGQYSPAGGTTCEACTAGNYCPQGATSETACTTGYFSAASAASCTLCPAGFYCPDTMTKTACPSGTYSGQGETSCTNCPAGYTSKNGSIECKACPAGFACPDAADPSKNYECAMGSYSIETSMVCRECPAGSHCPTNVDGNPINCPTGFYTTGNQTECTRCEAGFICPNTDGTGITPCVSGSYSEAGATECTKCPAGYACPETNTSQTMQCFPGEYSIGEQTECTPCPAGFKCPTTTAAVEVACLPGTYSVGNQSTCTECLAGYECPNTNDNTSIACEMGYFSLGNQQQCTLCPEGEYCPTTIESGQPCDNDGEYSDAGSTNCTTCEQGWYCPNFKASFKQQCRAGYYSTAGSTSCIRCNAGYRCQMESDTPSPLADQCDQGGWCDGEKFYPCPAGTYNKFNTSASVAACVLCPAGYYCEGPGEIDYSAYLCPEGHFCLEGTTSRTSFPCPASSECLMCAPGYYCPGGTENDPMTDPLPCPIGTYNPSWNSSDLVNCHPCEQGWAYGDVANLTSANDCKTCPAGYICGYATTDFEMTTAADQYPCPAGTFTNRSDLYEAAQCTPCTGGYYCIGGEKEPTGICPRGYYCPEGTLIGTEYGCPNGTYNDLEGLSSVDECKNCTQGHYCEFAVSATTQCREGTYMPYGDPAKRQFECIDCPGGSFCLNGTIDPAPCGTGNYSPVGHYCDNATTSEDDMLTNKICPAGRYCVGGLHSEPDAVDCDTGKYCPAGTVEMLNCPVGTMRTTVGAGAVTDCEPCTAGYYCLEMSTTETGPCLAGYYCPTNFSSPFDNKEPPYIGSYGNDMVNLVALDSCTQCDTGYYCDAPGLTLPRDQCDAGYLCYSGAVTSTPVNNATQGGERCPRGGYCLKGAIEALPCPKGTYSNITGAVDTSECTICDPGYYCSSVAGGEPTGPCAAGFYCEQEASSPYQFSATPGHFTLEGARAQEECPIATYAPYHNSSSCTTCPAGFYCPDKAMNYTIICPLGTYCAEGSYQYLSCPPGTFLNETGKSDLSDCIDCPTGFYCMDRGLSDVTGPCKAGHICYLNALDDDPVYNNDSSGGLTIITYGDRCHPGFYCPEGTTYMIPCPEGTYRGSYSGKAESDCTTCDPGKYCAGVNNTAATGDCDPGYYCNNGSHIANPVDGIIGDICPIHHYCPTGSDLPKTCPTGMMANSTGNFECALCTPGFLCYPNTEPQICPQGQYCPGSTDLVLITQGTDCPIGTYGHKEGLFDLSNCTACDAGSYCATPGAEVATPAVDDNVDYGLCPKGYYCPEGTTSPNPCPAGTYGSSEQLQALSDCTDCDPGYSCPDQNMIAKGTICSAGYYSQEDAEIERAFPLLQQCSYEVSLSIPGYYCPEGSSSALPCNTGTYAQNEGSATCTQCPQGFYCTANTTDPVSCPMGYYCPAGSVSDTTNACPVGKFNNLTERYQASDCVNCPAGYFCDSQGLPTPTGECDPGWYCTVAAITAQPSVASQGGQCQAGTYCPAGSGAPITCDPGEYCANAGDICPAGNYCPEGSAAGTQCPPGTYLPTTGAQTESECIACTQGYYCDGYGHYCPIGSHEEIRCDSGTYQDETGQSTCKECPQGHFCDNTIAPVVLFNSSICPQGYFCPAGTNYSTQYRCPMGTFGNSTGLYQISECTPCPGGYYCDQEAQTTYTQLCNPGFYCRQGAETGTPMEDSDAYECPVGHFCPQGTSEPQKCPAAPSGLCYAGYYCQNGSSSPTEVDCTKGHYCGNGTATPTPCPKGTLLRQLNSNMNTLSFRRFAPLCFAIAICAFVYITLQGTFNLSQMWVSNIRFENIEGTIPEKHAIMFLRKLFDEAMFFYSHKNGSNNLIY
ncbi:hypothetical protein MAR_034873 [Mya arenaria]|uniref:Tyrosine-protein kinase ephrin type A/B receptor-like domain-containing protein n=1 Tax=Mya arenaria TaxID=6604 RepID=A0ABY7ELD4_MYAAR|nr:hypothetical protein MAR_034873 [Mya arenaria]